MKKKESTEKQCLYPVLSVWESNDSTNAVSNITVFNWRLRWRFCHLSFACIKLENISVTLQIEFVMQPTLPSAVETRPAWEISSCSEKQHLCLRPPYINRTNQSANQPVKTKRRHLLAGQSKDQQSHSIIMSKSVYDTLWVEHLTLHFEYVTWHMEFSQ